MTKKKLIHYMLALALCPALMFASGKKEKTHKAPEETPQERAARLLSENDGAAYERAVVEGEAASFNEVWGFALQERSNELDFETPYTDIALFTSTLNYYGELVDVPNHLLLASFEGRTHMVFACDSRALVHYVLDPQFGLRAQFEKSLVNAVKNYDGLCIDMEYIPARDRGNFFSFLRDMKRMLNGKILSVCVPARMRTISDDIFHYKTISDIADRVIIMAYDEHWSTSKAGPVASLEWCGNVADYALTIIPKEKLVMGLPLYGRTWVNENHAGAWYFSGMNRKLLENGVTSVERDDGGVAKIEYSATINVTGYFDDTYSLVKKFRMYKEKGINKISFWRIGMEDTTLWQWIETDN
ncbi:MAG: glycoside hydrolase [Treponema sp.]|nr:glycoside hydrolase [Treponema sp.]